MSKDSRDCHGTERPAPRRAQPPPRVGSRRVHGQCTYGLRLAGLRESPPRGGVQASPRAVRSSAESGWLQRVLQHLGREAEACEGGVHLVAHEMLRHHRQVGNPRPAGELHAHLGAARELEEQQQRVLDEGKLEWVGAAAREEPMDLRLEQGHEPDGQRQIEQRVEETARRSGMRDGEAREEAQGGAALSRLRPTSLRPAMPTPLSADRGLLPVLPPLRIELLGKRARHRRPTGRQPDRLGSTPRQGGPPPVAAQRSAHHTTRRARLRVCPLVLRREQRRQPARGRGAAGRRSRFDKDVKRLLRPQDRLEQRDRGQSDRMRRALAEQRAERAPGHLVAVVAVIAKPPPEGWWTRGCCKRRLGPKKMREGADGGEDDRGVVEHALPRRGGRDPPHLRVRQCEQRVHRPRARPRRLPHLHIAGCLARRRSTVAAAANRLHRRQRDGATLRRGSKERADGGESGDEQGARATSAGVAAGDAAQRVSGGAVDWSRPRQHGQPAAFAPARSARTRLVAPAGAEAGEVRLEGGEE
mmetsp:Transcript_41140/g.129731  ORF Transcript_41140/g.129731 Transcript_41140/m.129731 type:complete len:529 (-) Transcript_41140:236-1822(-)